MIARDPEFEWPIIVYKRYGEMHRGFLHVEEREECRVLSHSLFHPSAPHRNIWMYYKEDYPTLEDAVEEYKRELEGYYLLY